MVTVCWSEHGLWSKHALSYPIKTLLQDTPKINAKMTDQRGIMVLEVVLNVREIHGVQLYMAV